MHGTMKFGRPTRHSFPVTRADDGRTKLAQRIKAIERELEAELTGVELTLIVRNEIRNAAMLMVSAEKLVERAGWGQSVDMDKMLRLQAAADRARDRLMKRAKAHGQ